MLMLAIMLMFIYLSILDYRVCIFICALVTAEGLQGG
jgi:hypothetical protein